MNETETKERILKVTLERLEKQAEIAKQAQDPAFQEAVKKSIEAAKETTELLASGDQPLESIMATCQSIIRSLQMAVTLKVFGMDSEEWERLSKRMDEEQDEAMYDAQYKAEMDQAREFQRLSLGKKKKR